MAHFAQIADDGTILTVTVISNEVLTDEDGVEQEQLGKDLCQSLFGGTWVQTSYNNNFRKQFAGIGFTYDKAKDKFIAPQPYPSWSLDSNDDWQAPSAMPDDGKLYYWDEDSKSWKERTSE